MCDLRDWAIAGLEAAGCEATEEFVASIESLATSVSGGDPAFTSLDGDMGLMALSPKAWERFNIGGDPYEPVASIATAIHYHLARWGALLSDR